VHPKGGVALAVTVVQKAPLVAAWAVADRAVTGEEIKCPATLFSATGEERVDERSNADSYRHRLSDLRHAEVNLKRRNILRLFLFC